MKKVFLGVVLIMVFALASLVWYGCTKEEFVEDGVNSGSIYGTVTDYATGDAIGNVNVKLRPSGETTLTGNDGSFEFKNLKAGKYTLFLSKAEYADHDDDNVIELVAGKKVKRDVQMRKQIASLKITDMGGLPITSLDFGQEMSIISKSFNIFNDGTLDITCQVIYKCNWIDTVIAMGMAVSPGQTLTVTVIINREQLPAGENSTIMHIISNNGSNELTILATGYGVPSVVTGQISKITTTSVECDGTVTASGEGDVLDYGLCYSTSNFPKIETDNHISLGSGLNHFSGTVTGLLPNTIYYVRAYASNNLGTAYGLTKQFKTKSPYDSLPSFSFNGHTYKVAPDPHTSHEEYFSWTQANSYCQNLTAFGYSDWRMPTIEELECMYQNREQIGGFINFYKSYTNRGESWNTRSWYHSSTQGSSGSHLRIRWDGGQRTEDYEDGYTNYNWGGSGYVSNKCHVRPIRIDQ